MTSASFRSHAKVNLHLQVVARRPDGYHELRTVFQMIDLHDRVDLCLDSEPRTALVVTGADLPAGPENLAWRAAEAFRERWAPGVGVRIRLEKRIPVGGGLGGGSSNAASVLLGLRALLGFPGPLSELWPVARDLGADAPFFLLGGTALGFGRGDELVPLPEPRPTRLWLAIPRVSVATAPIFNGLGDLTEAPLAPSIAGLLRDRSARRVTLDALGGWNDLQETVFRLFPQVAEVQTRLVAAGASWSRLSGSGAALVVRFDDPSRAQAASRMLPEGCRLLRVCTLPRSAWSKGWRHD